MTTPQTSQGAAPQMRMGAVPLAACPARRRRVVDRALAGALDRADAVRAAKVRAPRAGVGAAVDGERVRQSRRPSRGKRARAAGSLRLCGLAAIAVVALAAAGAPSCTCEAPPPGNDGGAVGQIVAAPVDGGFELRLENLQRPVRALQVDVKLTGVNATGAAAPAGGPDLVEAGLGVPKDDFTVVVGDTRRLNLPSGTVVKVSTDGAVSQVTLSHALAVDDSGAKRDVTVVVP